MEGPERHPSATRHSDRVIPCNRFLPEFLWKRHCCKLLDARVHVALRLFAKASKALQEAIACLIEDTLRHSSVLRCFRCSPSSTRELPEEGRHALASWDLFQVSLHVVQEGAEGAKIAFMLQEERLQLLSLLRRGTDPSHVCSYNLPRNLVLPEEVSREDYSCDSVDPRVQEGDLANVL